ncbi:hypothetical protein B9479_002685 [Cryptococcus floricola]|uniref:Trafficking protein particle complex subunit 11 domain-containing protein n=1 Tax=Cryptococcus floricola TaxID=2591691 RepID=A0A5D3B318_9TREE|nr:hypothetical protein B9479_002685 [Cryptococcus floricola]
MNSYPLEFLTSPQPLLFVAGLAVNPTPATRTRSESVVSTATTGTRRPSGGSLLESTGASQLPLTSPELAPPSPAGQETLPKSPEPLEPTEPAKPPLNERDQVFEELLVNLRGAFQRSTGKGRIWVDPKARRDFRVVIVDKGVKLPMRKVPPPVGASNSDAPTNPHSPLSPLIPSSPLYPDGLIAPVWVRKHSELVPSVFVLFLRLYESPPPPTGLETIEETRSRESEDRQREKEMDELLIKEISDRRRRLVERGIKLTVVLMASSQTLDSPALDPRLSHIRRQSQISSKASLFVLSPVPADQLPEFVASLQEALYESAFEYYSLHTKRVRRKRSRLPSNPPINSPVTTSSGQKILSPQGWAVRYDWKLGWFAEIRGEVEMARRHYEDCWNELAKMFASTTTLPPRTKRWAEAKVLADCVATRICKLSLYDAEGPRALGSFSVHLKRFGDLSRGWGIGEETFEFWSWIARQYRIFAELLEMAQQHGLRITTPLPTFPPPGAATTPQNVMYYATPISQGNPSQTIQHPAIYYYTAACCTLKRQERFKEILEIENDALSSEAGKASGYVSAAPGFANEKKVDHSALAIELFSKAYSLLKDLPTPSNRTALYIAYRIADTYHKTGQYEMAIRFFDRIASSFKKERWDEIVRDIRKVWYDCAKATGGVEGVGRLILEMMCAGNSIGQEEREDLQEELVSLLKTTAPSTSSDKILIEMNGPSDKELLDVRAGFWQPDAAASQEVPYQVTLRCPSNVIIGNLEFSEIELNFTDDRLPIKISNEPSTSGGHVSVVDLNTTTVAPLKWAPNQVLVLNGTLTSTHANEVQLANVKLRLKQGSWAFELAFVPGEITGWMTKKGIVNHGATLSSSVFFSPEPHKVDVEITHQPFAFVGEDLPIQVKVINNDERTMEATLSIFMQPAEDGEEDGSRISVSAQETTTLLRDIALGTLAPGASISLPVHLWAPAESTKIIDFALHTTVNGSPESLSASAETHMTEERPEEVNRTVVVPVLKAFAIETSVKLTNQGKKGGKGAVGLNIRVGGPRRVIVEGLELVANKDDREVKMISTSLDGVTFSEEWDEQTSYAVWAVFDLAQGHRGAVGNPILIPAELVISWKSDSEGPLVKTTHPLPPLLIPPPTDSFLIPTLHLPAPAIVSPHTAFPLSVSILNTHPTHAASEVSIVAETSDSFAWVGNRQIRLTEIAPGRETEVKLECVALGGSGWVKVPNIIVWDGDGEDREEVRVKGDSMVLIRST